MGAQGGLAEAVEHSCKQRLPLANGLTQPPSDCSLRCLWRSFMSPLLPWDKVKLGSYTIAPLKPTLPFHQCQKGANAEQMHEAKQIKTVKRGCWS